jgi:hypothetical protein
VVTYFAGQKPNAEWRRPLSYCLEQADSFAGHFADGPGRLSCGRDDFPEGVSTGEWNLA